MSVNPAPPRRSSNTASTRAATSALFALPGTVRLVDPSGMLVVKLRGVHQAELFPVVVRAQVRAPLENQLQPVGELQARHLAVRPRGGDGLPPRLELPDGL